MLEDRITYVATKVVHLGDQLESSNNRRMRAIEAVELMKYLEEFKTRSRPNLPVFTDPGRVSLASAHAAVPCSVLRVMLPLSLPETGSCSSGQQTPLVSWRTAKF